MTQTIWTERIHSASNLIFYMGMRQACSVLRFKENCSLSLIGAWDTSVEFGGLVISNEKLWKETNQENINI
jgi:hypothetical protein